MYILFKRLGQSYAGEPFYGHGLAFFLASVDFQIPTNSIGGFLGLFNSTNRLPGHQVFAVEFDSYVNEDWDPPYQHAGINSNSISSAVASPWNASLQSGRIADVLVTYNASTMNMSLSWTYGVNTSSLNYNVDLSKVLSEWVVIGFSATTGQIRQRNILNSWEFNSTLDIKDEERSNSKTHTIIVGVVTSIGILVAMGFVALVIRRRRRRMIKEKGQGLNLISMNNDLERGAGPKRFSYGDLVSATKNFASERKLGEGGFGCVYKGYLLDLDIPVAVKKISSRSRQGKKEYVTEVKIISQLRHRNLVQLIGWCHDHDDFLLVYEFMANGSLDSHLFNEKNYINWSMRYKVAFGIASALLYLHEECEQCVVHRDIKSSNIMLDSTFNVKLGDFGLARLVDHDCGPKTTGLAGTLGYMAPEYIATGRASKESDVYSFGVVALEIVRGRKSTHSMDDTSEMGLVEWVWNLYGRDEVLLAVDGRLGMDYDAKQVECLALVGLWCAHPDHRLRPSIRQVIQVLNFEATIPNLPQKMPVPMYSVPVQAPIEEEPSMTFTSLSTGR